MLCLQAAMGFSASALSALLPHLSLSVCLGFLLLLLILVILYKAVNAANKTHNMPPGPVPLPVIGNIHLFFGKREDDVFSELTQKYGDIFTLKIGPTYAVVLNSNEIMAEALHKQGDNFSDRPMTPLKRKDIWPLQAGVIFSDGDIWKSNRRFCLRHLRDLGLGRQSHEPHITREVTMYMDELRRRNGKPIDMRLSLASAVSNVICCMVFGKRFEYSDPVLHEIVQRVNGFAKIPYFLTVINFTDEIPYFGKRMIRKAVDNRRVVKGVVDKILKEHKDVFDHDDTLGDDLINFYLRGKLGQLEVGKGINERIFEDDQIGRLIYDCFAAGTETTSTLLLWALVYMLNFPDIQEKVRSEIYDSIGKERFPSIADKAHLPYTQAVITEVLRTGNIVSKSVPHCTSSDVELRGYKIPAKTPIIPNLTAVNLNDKEFPQPHVFRPERFIDGKGNFNKELAEKIVSFGIGKRLCLGENMARMEIFLFFASMMQQFRFEVPFGDAPPSLMGTARFINSPKPFTLCAISLTSQGQR